ncbi:MAG: VWA domain-containing protein [Hyphomonadaceae bacterium]|nr:VWA domain-containing protein [Hyphomonadaceae bacterium]
MKQFRKSFGEFAKDECGGFAIAFAVSVAMLILGIAVSMDFRHMASTRATLNDLADSAALAGAKIADIDDDERREIVEEMIETNAKTNGRAFSLGEPTIIFDDDAREVTVRLDASLEMLMMGMTGNKNMNLSGTSVVGYQTLEIDPVSIAFALDVSGSMGDVTTDGRTKIEVLKTSTASLFDAVEDSLPDPSLLEDKIRSGMSAYNTKMVEEFPMDYGWSGLESDVNALVAGGGTNSTPALQNAYNQLKNDPVQPDNLRQFVIFMTDGDNNQPVWDEESAELCWQMRNEGIEIFSVAFAAPDKGQYLLVDCASPNGTKKGKKGKKGNNGNGNGNGNGNNSGPGNNGQGNAYGHFKNKKDLEDRKKDKSDYYFDAADAKAFEDAFKSIGQEIGELNIVIKR